MRRVREAGVHGRGADQSALRHPLRRALQRRPPLEVPERLPRRGLETPQRARSLEPQTARELGLRHALHGVRVDFV
jgi:hypothetical protein